MPRLMRAHDTTTVQRTQDVGSGERTDFSSLLLSGPVLTGLAAAGFHHPSPIQAQAIPLGKAGFDLVAQAKSGTGKTCVFTVVILESLDLSRPQPQALVLAPTREIAVQIQDVIMTIGSAMPGLACHAFIGGLPVSEDRQRLRCCHVVVGTPGRIKYLLESGLLSAVSLRVCVLDEADKLMDRNFRETLDWIYSKLPARKQMMSFSATYPEELAQLLGTYMVDPVQVRLDKDRPSLIGVRQYYRVVAGSSLAYQVHEAKTKALLALLLQLPFAQCIVFTNAKPRAEQLARTLTENNWPAACIAGGQEQTRRLKAIGMLRDYRLRVLVSTDLTARGVDADNVNLVINLDVPQDKETYLHRIGRSGRYGGYGVAVTFVSDSEVAALQRLASNCNTEIALLPDPPPADFRAAVEQAMEGKHVPTDTATREELLEMAASSRPKKEKTPKTDQSAKPSDSHPNGQESHDHHAYSQSEYTNQADPNHHHPGTHDAFGGWGDWWQTLGGGSYGYGGGEGSTYGYGWGQGGLGGPHTYGGGEAGAWDAWHEHYRHSHSGCALCRAHYTAWGYPQWPWY